MGIVRERLVLRSVAVLFFLGIALVSAVARPETRALVAVGDYDYPPHTFLDKNTGNPTGYDVDIVNEIAAKMHTKVDIRLLKWEQAQARIDRGEADLLISTLHTRDRERRFDFTIPYHAEYHAIFVRKQSPIRGLSDLKGKTIIALKGDASVENFIKPKGLYGKAVFVDSLPIAIKLLNSGKHDFVVAPYVTGMETIAKSNCRNIKVVGPPILPSLYRLAVKKGNSALLAQLNEAIDQVKSSTKYGQLDRKWFKYHRTEEPTATILIKYAAYVGVLVFSVFIVLFTWSWTLKRQVRKKTLDLRKSQHALQESEKRLSTTLNSIGDAVISTDAHGRVVAMNPVAEELTGCVLFEAVGNPILEVLRIVDALTNEPSLVPVDEVLSTGEVCHLADNTTLISRDGTQRQIADSIAPVRDDSGNITGVVLVFSDVSEQYRIREELRTSEDKYRNLIDMTGTGYLILDVQGRVLDANQEYVRLSGHTRLRDILGKTVIEWTAERAKQLNAAAIVQCTQRGFIRDFSTEYVDGNGKITPVEINASVQGEGDSLRIVSLCRDITERKLAEEQLELVTERLSLAARAGGVGIWDYDTVNNRLIWDDQMYRLYGITPDQFGGAYESWQAGVHPEDAQRGHTEIDMALRGEKEFDTEFRVAWPDGSTHCIRAIAVVQRDASGLPLNMIGTNWDITESKKAEEALRESEEKHRLLIENSHDIIYLLTTDGVFEYVSPAWTALLGHPSAKVVGQSFQEFVHPDDIPGCMVFMRSVIETGERQEGIEYRVQHIDGSWYWHTTSAVPLRDATGRVTGFEGTARDITARKQAENELRQANAKIDNVNRQLEVALLAAREHARDVEVAKDRIEEDAAAMDYQAHHDALTNLPNRLLFSKELTKTISDRRRKRRQFAVLFIDLDRFKLVNDTMGHKAGDTLLVETATMLGSCMREGDILARMGGDEFTVLLRSVRSKDDVAMIAHRMLEQLATPFDIGGYKLVIGASVGVSIYPENATDADGLLKTADAAMYKAKELGRNNCQFFSDELGQASMARVEMDCDFRLAVEREELVVYYQPIVDVRTMQIVGAEALLRWNHPEKGHISPSLFMPVAEENGLILPVGKMVLETACKQCRDWQNMGIEDLEISVKVSPAQLSEIEFISQVDAVLSAVGLSPQSLIIQVTESVLDQNSSDKLDVLGVLKALGVRLCLDDFGVGYSSLSRLKKIPIAHLKVDGFFTSNVDRNQNDRAMTESIIGMAHNLGIKVTAECIEEAEQLEAIKSLGCDYAQGYLISPAMPADAFGEFAREWAITHHK